MRCTRFVLALVVVSLLAGCGFIGDSFEGKTVYPSAGPVPQAGTVWEIVDGTAGLLLRSDGKADVWGLPWYPGTRNCYVEDLVFVTATLDVEVHSTSSRQELTVSLDVSEYFDDGVYIENRPLYCDKFHEGWSVLTYTSCHLFNDGHDLELHMVEP